MTIDEHIGVIEDLKSTMSVCMPEPEKTEICTSLSEAIDTMRKYQKIKKVVAKWKADTFTDGFSWDCMKEIADIVDKGESEVDNENDKS